MPKFSSDGSGNKTKIHSPENSDSACEPVTEEDGLLKGVLKEGETGPDDKELLPPSDEENAKFLDMIAQSYEYIAEHAQDAAGDFREAVVDGYENVMEGVENWTGAIAEEVHDYRDNFMGGLHEKNEGESVLYEMSMARNLSILPSDMEIFAEEIGNPAEANPVGNMIFPPKAGHRRIVSTTHKFLDEEGQLQEEIVEKTVYAGAIPFNAYLTLFIAVVSLSSIAPSLDMQRNVIPTMKIFWRMSATYIALSPFALKSLYKDGFPRLSWTQICTLGMTGFCYALFCVTFVIALEYTSVANVVILSNSQSLLLLVGKVLVGQAVSLMEAGGALIAFCGVILCACDSSALTGNTFSTDTSAAVVWSGVGDVLAFFSALGGVGYLVFAKTLREHIPNVFVFMFINMVVGSLFVLLYLWISDQHFTFDRHINTGLWGWMNISRMDRLPLEIYMVCICNLLGTMGYLRSMQYFDNLVITVATLMEPIVASFMAYLLKCGLLPGWLGWIGNVTVMAGTVLVIYPNAHKKSSDMH